MTLHIQQPQYLCISMFPKFLHSTFYSTYVYQTSLTITFTGHFFLLLKHKSCNNSIMIPSKMLHPADKLIYDHGIHSIYLTYTRKHIDSEMNKKIKPIEILQNCLGSTVTQYLNGLYFRNYSCPLLSATLSFKEFKQELINFFITLTSVAV